MLSAYHPTPGGWWKHYAALVVLALAVCALFIREPGFGDDLTYWSLAFNLRESGGAAWHVHSFHDLRWPVWGVTWLWQSCFGPGLASYYCVPMLYLAGAAALAFTFGRIVIHTAAGAWTCAFALLFIPLLDAVISRPMPDLSEGVFGGCALLAWWTMMHAPTSGRAVLHGVVSGVAIGLAFSNRATGIFIAPVLVVATLLAFPRRWQWLLVPAAAALIFFLVECAVYHSICGDWLHSLHANLGAARAKDVTEMSPWRLPVRYLSGFIRGNRLATVYAVLACAGLWTGWRQWGRSGRLVVVWFSVLYLEYSCAVQSIHPVLPLIGSTFRYLAVVALPMSVLVGMGAVAAGRWLAGCEWIRNSGVVPRLGRHPVPIGMAFLALLAICSTRPYFDLGFTRDLRWHMAWLPDGTRIFSHQAMRNVAWLVDPDAARCFAWVAPKEILFHDPALERQAAGSDEFWYLRKHVWLNERKRIERGHSRSQSPLATYFDHPERDWTPAGALVKGEGAEMVFYRRRTPEMPAARELSANAPEFSGFLPSLPASWTARDGKVLSRTWKIPAAMRGKVVTFEVETVSPTVEPLTVKLDFALSDGRHEVIRFHPIFYPGGGEDFFAIQIPSGAEQCRAEVEFHTSAKAVRCTGFHASFEAQQ
ncbi:MAG: hypothetical protein ABI680_12350 [Chthoniobacteraceae bacterium]